MVDQGFLRPEKPYKKCMSREYPREVIDREVLKAYIKEFIKKNYALPIVRRKLTP